MAADEWAAIDEVIQMLETKPSSFPNVQPDTPTIREQVPILVSTRKAKEAIGVKLTQDQVKRLENVERYHKRYETYVGTRTIETYVEMWAAAHGGQHMHSSDHNETYRSQSTWAASSTCRAKPPFSYCWWLPT